MISPPPHRFTHRTTTVITSPLLHLLLDLLRLLEVQLNSNTDNTSMSLLAFYMWPAKILLPIIILDNISISFSISLFHPSCLVLRQPCFWFPIINKLKLLKKKCPTVCLMFFRNVTTAPSAVNLPVHTFIMSLCRSSVSVAKTNHTQLWRATTRNGMLKHFSVTLKLIWSNFLCYFSVDSNVKIAFLSIQYLQNLTV